MFQFFSDLFQSMLNGIGNLFQGLLSVISNIFSAVIDVFGAILELFVDVAKLLGDLMKVGLGLFDVLISIVQGGIATLGALMSFQGVKNAPIHGGGYDYANEFMYVLNAGGLQTLGYLLGAVVWLLAFVGVVKVVRRS